MLQARRPAGRGGGGANGGGYGGEGGGGDVHALQRLLHRQYKSFIAVSAHVGHAHDKVETLRKRCAPGVSVSQCS